MDKLHMDEVFQSWEGRGNFRGDVVIRNIFILSILCINYIFSDKLIMLDPEGYRQCFQICMVRII